MDDLIAEFITESSESLAQIDNDLVKLEQDPNNSELIGNIFRLMHTVKGTCGFLGLPRLESVAHSAENVLGRFRDGDLEIKPEYVTLIFESIDQVRFLLETIGETGQEPEGDDSALIAKLDAVYEGKAVEAPATDDALLEETSEAETKDSAQEDVPEETAIIEETQKQEPTTPAVAEAAETGAPKAAAPTVTQSLRVNVDVLEDLMTMVSELVLTRNQLLQISRTQADTDFSAPLQRLNHVVSDLQEGVMKTRMQPIGNAWGKLPRIIRDLCQELGKKIDLEMRGQETELDRQVLDLIKDPLTHMVRNSGDHGVETPQERAAAGKPETGKIVLNAYHEGGHIIIEISDDGKGLNTERIKQKVQDSRLATADELSEMTDKQINQFIFHAGLSTAEKVTSVSGRGVGMDVVRTNIEKIGGTIELDSVQGKGTTFTIKIPLTLAIVSALIVEAGGERFAIPQLSVQELVMTSEDGDNRIETIKGAAVFRLRERLLPLIRLSDLLKLKTIHVNPESITDKTESSAQEDSNEQQAVKQSQADKIAREASRADYIVVTQVGPYNFGIIVDKVFDTEEIVVKPVAKILKGIEIFSGNTILGDGSVIMILDPAGIARSTGEMAVSKDQKGSLREQEEAERKRREMNKSALILFTAGNSKTPKAVPLSLVSRLEEFATEKLEESDGRLLIQYRNTLMPLKKFDESIDLSAEKSFDTLVFIDENTGNAMGLIVGEILDIVDDHMEIKMSSDNPAYIGSCVIQDKATDIINVGHWLTAINSKWFGEHNGQPFGAKSNGSTSNGYGDGRKNVLLVDDSPFFRNMLTPLLSVAGYNVTTAESPVEALELCEKGETFDIIVSDIEMPEMDGFTFAEKVKSDSNWQNVPMVALSSHTTPQDIDHGMQKGFSRYVSKLDRDVLLNTLSETLAEGESQVK